MLSNIRFLFIEADPERSDHLESVLEGFGQQIPSNCAYKVIQGKFDETLNEGLDAIEAHNKQLAPSFVMIDPFGVSGTPMKTIG